MMDDGMLHAHKSMDGAPLWFTLGLFKLWAEDNACAPRPDPDGTKTEG